MNQDSTDRDQHCPALSLVQRATSILGRPMLVDCHTHLYDEQFDRDRHELLMRCRTEAGIDRVLVVSEDDSTADKMAAIWEGLPASLRPMWQQCLGLHPCSVRSRTQVRRFCDRIRHQRDSIVAIGEVGLDFTPWYLAHILQQIQALEQAQGEEGVDEKNGEDGGGSVKSECVHSGRVSSTDDVKELQRYALREFAKLSIELDLPLNVHSRSAGRPTVQLLLEAGARRVLLHCFDGSAKVARQACQLGYHFSIPASVVRSPDMQRLVRDVIPLDLMMLETDSPALHPAKPGKVQGDTEVLRNDPTNIVHCAAAIAEIKGISVQQVIEATYRNARRLFPRAFV